LITDLSIIRNGFCDRLKLLTFYIAVATVKNDPVLYIKEEKSHAGPFDFLEFCEIEGLRAEPWNEGVKDKSLEIDYGFEPGIKPSLKFVRCNKPKGLKITDKAFLKLWISCYKRIKPIQRIRQKIEKLGVGSDCLGIHIRMTDKFVAKVTDCITPYAIVPSQLKKINEIIEEEARGFMADNAGGRVYLASDSGEWNAIWSDKLREIGCTVISNDSHYSKDHFRETNGEDFIMDLFSLARCKSMIGTVDSGVVICASYINGSSEYSFAFSKLVFSKYINYARWVLLYHYHMNLFDFHHSVIVRYALKIRPIRRLADKMIDRRKNRML